MIEKEYEQFNMTDNLAEVITQAINSFEEDKYVCKIEKCLINHNHKERTCPFLIIMKEADYLKFSQQTFMTKDDILVYLLNLDGIFMEYFGEFKPTIMLEKFPYLKELFDYIYSWRQETNRVTIDEEVLKRSLKRIGVDNICQP